MMTFDEVVLKARSGHHRRNLMVKIKSLQVANDNGSTFPLLFARDSIVHLAEFGYEESDGSRVYGGLQKLTGMGDEFDEYLRDSSGVIGGSLQYAVTDSPLMQEMVLIDWTNDEFEARIAFDDQTWDEAYRLGAGRLDDAQIDSGVMTWRVTGIKYRLTEEITAFYWEGSDYHPSYQYAIPFGYVYAMPVRATGQKDGADFVYGTSLFAASNASYRLYDGDPYGAVTGDIPYSGDPDRASVATASSGWALGTSYPENYVYTDVFGYCPGCSSFTYNTAPEILIQAFNIALRNDNGFYVPILPGIGINFDSLDEFNSKCDYGAGINFGGKNVTHQTLEATGDVYIEGDLWEWQEALNALVGDSNAIYSIDNQNTLTFHWLMEEPTGDPKLTLANSDFTDFKITKVKNLSFVSITSANEVNTTYYSGIGSSVAGNYEAFINNDPRGVEIQYTTLNHGSSTLNQVASDLLNRFGDRDYRFTNCLVASALNIGDVIGFDDSIDEYITSSMKGYVIGIERGSDPYVVVRVDTGGGSPP